MNIQKTSDLRIAGRQEVVSAKSLISEQPISEKSSETVFNARKEFSDVLYKKDERLAVVVGPCSIHDPSAAKEYAELLLNEKNNLKDNLLIIMRVYFEKPRTTAGWKGLINDPDLDNSFNIDKGLSIARQLLRDINDMGMPAGTEFLDVITPQYIADLISWGAIGARTTESQVHRELASGSSCPIGFKNATNGGIQVAADAIGSALHPHKFLSVTKEGKAAIFSSSGNKDCHVILRGGKEPNYTQEFINSTSEILQSNETDGNASDMQTCDLCCGETYEHPADQPCPVAACLPCETTETSDSKSSAITLTRTLLIGGIIIAALVLGLSGRKKGWQEDESFEIDLNDQEN